MNKSVVNLLIILVALFFSSVTQATLITNLTQAELDSGDYSNAEDQLTNNLLGVLPTVQPILEHRFDETGYSDTPNEIIDTVGSFHGQAKGSQPVEGKICNAIDLSATGTSDYAVLDKDILAAKTDFTISVWAKTTKTTNQSILSGAGNSTNELIMWFTRHTNFRPHLKNAKNGSIPTSSIAGNIWRHLVWTREGTQNCLFINKVLQGCLSLAHSTLKLDIQSLILGQEQDSIGGGFSSDQAFDGLLDEFLVFDSAITSAHIATIYDNQNAGNNYDGSSRECDNASPLIEAVAGRVILNDTTSSDAIAQEVIGTRALMAANSGMQAELSVLFPLATNAANPHPVGTCNVNNTYYLQSSGNDITGLYHCNSNITCDLYHTQNLLNYYRLISTGGCGSSAIASDSKGVVISSRIIQVEARSL